MGDKGTLGGRRGGNGLESGCCRDSGTVVCAGRGVVLPWCGVALVKG
jgi:hypothetical protein